MANVLRRFLISQSIVFPQIFGMIIGMKRRYYLLGNFILLIYFKLLLLLN